MRVAGDLSCVAWARTSNRLVTGGQVGLYHFCFRHHSRDPAGEQAITSA
jgi:hypothetical protein